MGKFFRCLGILVVLIFGVGCTNTSRNLNIQPTISVKENSTLTNTPLPQTATHTIAPSPTKRPTETATPTRKPENLSAPQWNTDFNMESFEGDYGLWANTTDAFLFEKSPDNRNDNFTLNKVTAPDFKPEELPSDIIFSADGPWNTFIWSPDSQSIVYSCCLKKDAALQLCVMGADGNNPHVTDPDRIAMHFYSLEGWLDQKNLLMTDYNGGGHFSIIRLDMETGEEYFQASIHGITYSPHNNYIPAIDNSIEPYYYKLLVISDKFPSTIIEESPDVEGNFIRFPEYRSIPRGQTVSYFEDWLPNSNQMLVLWGTFDPSDWELQGNELLLWDVDKNKVRLIAPNGRGGKFSPDGNLLAYLTNGPAKLDGTSRPIAEKTPPTDQVLDYLQLLDMSSGKVNMSIPVIAQLDYDYDYNDDILKAHGVPNSVFSPDGRYLSFFTPGSLVVNSSGWPIDVDQTGPSLVYLNLLDLQAKKVVWSGLSNRETEVTWSPVSNSMIYQDISFNWQFLDLKEYKAIPITLANGKQVSNPAWSFDGKFFSLETRSSSETIGNNSSISIFAVTK